MTCLVVNPPVMITRNFEHKTVTKNGHKKSGHKKRSQKKRSQNGHSSVSFLKSFFVV